jgi:transposase
VQNELDKAEVKFEETIIMFQDEARFGRINSPHKCWVKGKRPYVYCQIVREYTYVYAAVCPFDGTMDSFVIPSVSSGAMGVFLDEIAKRHREKTVLMFLDQAGWHTAKELNVPQNMRLSYLPPYSPELNPTEHIWDELREKWFHNYTFDSIGSVEDRLVEGLLSLENNKALVESMSSFDWIVSIL